MKKLLKVSSFILPAWFALLISCGKDSSLINSPPPPQLFLDSLRGREFVFNDLIWAQNPFGGGDVMVRISDRPDLFSYPFRTMNVSIRLDTSAIWLDTPEFSLYFFPIAGFSFFYSLEETYGGIFSLDIFPYPAIPSLKGRKVSVRIKFI